MAQDMVTPGQLDIAAATPSNSTLKPCEDINVENVLLLYQRIKHLHFDLIVDSPEVTYRAIQIHNTNIARIIHRRT